MLTVLNVHVCQGDESAAITQLVCHVHYRPDAVCRWVRLAQLLLSQFADTHQSQVTHCCQVAVTSGDISAHSVGLSVCLYVSVCLSVCLSLSVCPSVSVCLFVCLTHSLLSSCCH